MLTLSTFDSGGSKIFEKKGGGAGRVFGFGARGSEATKRGWCWMGCALPLQELFQFSA